jgi:hypothetical protein
LPSSNGAHSRRFRLDAVERLAQAAHPAGERGHESLDPMRLSILRMTFVLFLGGVRAAVRAVQEIER